MLMGLDLGVDNLLLFGNLANTHKVHPNTQDEMVFHEPVWQTLLIEEEVEGDPGDGEHGVECDCIVLPSAVTVGPFGPTSVFFPGDKK